MPSYGTLEIPITLQEDDQGNAVLTGQNRNGEDFYLPLDYPMAGVIVKDSYGTDLTGDSNDELCIELNIRNNISPDMTTLLVYDMDTQKPLFPSGKKPLIYDGEIADLGTGKILLYKEFEKINGIAVESEYAASKWNGTDFETFRYYQKLLAETDQYLLFYDNTDDLEENNAYKLSVVDPESLETIQEIKIIPDKEVDIVGKINQGVLVVADPTLDGETVDLFLEGYGILHWNEAENLFETIPAVLSSEEVEQVYFCDGLGFDYSPNDSKSPVLDTYVCYPDYEGDREQFLKDYLNKYETYQEEPDGVNERFNKRCTEYYINEEKQRISFVFYKDWDDNSAQDCIYVVTIDQDRLQQQGYLAHLYDENGGPTYQRSYDADGKLEGYISYEYDPAIPFPIISEHKEYIDYPQFGINNPHYHEFYKEDMVFDEAGKWSGYQSCFLCGRETRHDNICVYNSEGKLTAVREELLEEDQIETYYRDYSGEISIEYNDTGRPISSNYWGSNRTHRIGSGISGEFKYDDKGRVISWSFINGDIFFVYEGDNQMPWARIRIGGNPYSSDEVEDGIAYGHSTNVFLFLPN